MRVWVTGSLGFIGSAFCHRFGSRWELIGVDFEGWGSMRENQAPGVAQHKLDISDADAVRSLMDLHKPQAIVNFAAESHVDRSIQSDLGFWQSNLMGARVLGWEAIRRKIRLVHVSTDEVYGDAVESGAAWTENSPVSPRNPYSASKAAADGMLQAYHHTHGLEVVITRGTNTIGPRQLPEKALPKAVHAFMRGEAFPLYKTPARRMWMHVWDHVDGVAAALERGKAGEIYHLAPQASNEAYTSQVIEAVRARVGKGQIQLVQDRPGYDLRYWLDANKARRDLGWSPKLDLNAAVADAVDWYVGNANWLDAARARMADWESGR